MIWGAMIVFGIYFGLIATGVIWGLEPGRIVRRLRVWFWERRIEREANRRLRQAEKARRAADWALASDYRRADRRETRAAIELTIIGVVVIGMVVALIVAGCGGVYPLEPSPDAGADTGAPLPPCAAPAGYVVIAHGCDCASDPFADDCGTETSQGSDHRVLVNCRIGNGEHCVADCAGCAP